MQQGGGDRWHEAELLAHCHERDLALLAVQDEAFWESVTFLNVEELPQDFEVERRVTLAGCATHRRSL